MKIKKNIALSESGFVFNPSTGESFSVNPIGIEIFNALKEEQAYEEIQQMMLSKYNTDVDTFEKDYNDFTQLLNSFQLIESSNEE